MQVDFPEFEASLVYTVSFRTARATIKRLVSKEREGERERKEGREEGRRKGIKRKVESIKTNLNMDNRSK